MSEKPIPEEARRLIEGFIQTLEQLEILLLLRGSPTKTFSAKDVFRVIQSSENSVATALKAFTVAGFLKEENGGLFRYEARHAEMDKGLSVLAQTYQERRVAVIEAIYSQAPDPVKNFAEAFKLRKGK